MVVRLERIGHGAKLARGLVCPLVGVTLEIPDAEKQRGADQHAAEQPWRVFHGQALDRLQLFIIGQIFF